MKPNTRLRLEQGLFIVIILIVIGLVIRGHKQTEHLASVTHWAQEKTVIEYINSKDDLKPVKFVLAQQIVDISGDESKFERVILLAHDNKKEEIIQIINNL
jgi:hypothetical protein